MRFSVELHRIKTGEWLKAFGDDIALAALMARFMIDEKGDPIPEDKAAEIIADTTIDQFIEAQEDFLTDYARARKIFGH